MCAMLLMLCYVVVRVPVSFSALVTWWYPHFISFNTEAYANVYSLRE